MDIVNSEYLSLDNLPKHILTEFDVGIVNDPSENPRIVTDPVASILSEANNYWQFH